MKTISILMLLSLTLTSCTVYRKKITEQYPAKYEYRCIRDVCKDVNMNYKVERIPKDKYKHLSEEELKNKEIKFDFIPAIIQGGMLFIVPIAVATSVTISKWGGGITGKLAAAGTGGGAAIGVFFVLGIGIIFIPMLICNSEGEDKFYDMSCSIGKQKPSEAK